MLNVASHCSPVVEPRTGSDELEALIVGVGQKPCEETPIYFEDHGMEKGGWFLSAPGLDAVPVQPRWPTAVLPLYEIRWRCEQSLGRCPTIPWKQLAAEFGDC